MEFETVSQRIADAFPRLSPQLQRAARHVLDHPDDVALMSMRRLAASAQVHPSTMVRLARSFEFASYNSFREPFQHRLRGRTGGYLDRARDLQSRGSGGATSALVEEILDNALANVRDGFETNSTATLSTCAEALGGARRVYVVGLRGCFPVAFFFHYVYRMFRDNVVLLDGRGGTFADESRALEPGDLVFAISVEPYTHETVRAVDYAKRQGGTAVVLTDSPVSPLARNADHVIIVGTESPSFFHSMAPAMALAEALVILMVARGGQEALDTIAESEGQLDDFDASWHAETPKQRRGKPA
jgi:DNA-binding MurR/RpiR family transcriptional regulator